MSGRGPSYTPDEIKGLAKIGSTKQTLAEKADAFIAQFGDVRTKTALIQKFRKIEAAEAPRAKKQSKKDAPAPAHAGTNGHALTREQARFELPGGIVVSGPAKGVARFVAFVASQL